MSKLTVAVIFGGCSEEHPISLKSAQNILENMNEDIYDIIMLGITKDGRWYRYDGPAEQIINDGWIKDEYITPAFIVPNRDIHGMIELHGKEAVSRRIDVAFPVLHGKYGEDGTIQGLFELAGIPYVGCDVYSSVLCMDKDIAHQNVKAAGVKVTKSVILYDYETLSQIEEIVSTFTYPLFVKPASSGSSFGVSKVDTRNELEAAIEEARRHDHKIIIEEGVSGQEVGCAVMGRGKDLTVGEVDQIELSHGFFRIHQEEKPEETSENSTIHVPADLEQEVTEEIKRSAKIVYRALGCSGLARVDMFLTPENEVVFNEVNSMPGFTTYSRYPRMMKAAGLGVKEIIDQVIRMARYEKLERMV